MIITLLISMDILAASQISQWQVRKVVYSGGENQSEVITPVGNRYFYLDAQTMSPIFWKVV